MQRDGHQKSIWQVTSDPIAQRSTTITSTTDVIVVGGGITGCTTALELARAGVKCTLVEAHTLGFGTTGGTTAHLNTILDHTYPEIEDNFGKDESRLLADGLEHALQYVEKNVSSLSIDCGHAWKDGYIFSQNEKETDQLKKIFEASLRAGIEVEWSNALPIGSPHEKVMRIKGQAQFHPLRYINALAGEFVRLGGTLIENCRLEKIDTGDTIVAHTSREEIRAKQLIYATHIPPGINLLHFRCAPYRSYAIAVELASGNYPDALVYDMKDPYHYYRTQEIDGKKWLIVGGEDHKTGHQEKTDRCLEALITHARQLFSISNVGHQWSSQFFETTDGLPYIGTLPGNADNVMVATGFSGNGITLGTLAGIVLSERIAKGESRFTDLFSPGRLSPVAGFTDFVKENADVIGHMISKPFLAEKIEGLSEITNGEGRLVKHEGDQLAIYKDEAGSIHALNPTCPHAKCTVKWNSAERSWDCPCHGSRFSVDGELLTGPSTHDLKKVDLK
jgi:glycine/D-amino acid oxidase-like deaminating enzyme/nitrite reductase/ring-hydroxylating ferredoxin subunit